MTDEDLFITDELRNFVKEVVAVLDTPGSTKNRDGEDAFRHEVGYGGRVGHEGGEDIFAFTYLTKDRVTKWTFKVRETALREIADGLLVEVAADKVGLDRSASGPRKASGAGLLVWGEFGDDALLLPRVEVLEAALDGLHAAAWERPRLLRLWSPTDDQVVAVIDRDECALYVVESAEGYATTQGGLAGGQATEVFDHDGRILVVPSADRLTWANARMGLLLFYEHGDLGTGIKVEGSIPSGLMMMGDADRKAVLAARPEPPDELSKSSVPRLLAAATAGATSSGAPAYPLLDTGTMPVMPAGATRTPEQLTDWARRLIAALQERELIVFGRANRDEIAYEVGNLLGVHAMEAISSLDTADWLANEVGAIRGIVRIFASGGDLQHLLKRSMKEPE